MELAYGLREGFAPLAWVASHREGCARIDVEHGIHVETRPGFFIEGAWADDFAEGQLHASDTVFGSGAAVAGESVVFVTCTATTDGLYYAQREGRGCVSNSLPALLAVLEDGLDPASTGYATINQSQLDGFRDYLPEIPTVRGVVQRLLYRNLELHSDGRFCLLDKPDCPDFQSYAEYQALLHKRVELLLENARDPARSRPLKILSTQSRGYDTTVVNVLAAPFGVELAYTCTGSKESGSFHSVGQRIETPSDDGTGICLRLGIPCERIDRLAFDPANFPEEPYYWAGVDFNEDLNMHAIVMHAASPALLLTGRWGEFWYTGRIASKGLMRYFTDDLRTWDHSGFGLAEIRLHAGFSQVSIPAIGSRHRQSLLKISDSPEMAPWRLGTDYDRPIPRRIAEEAGIPRADFGQQKLASIVHLPTPRLPVSEALADAYRKHLRAHRLIGVVGWWLMPWVQRINGWIHWKRPNDWFTNKQNRVLWHLGYYFARLTGKRLRFTLLWQRYDSYLYSYCVNRVRDEYRAARISASVPVDPATSPERPRRDGCSQ